MPVKPETNFIRKVRKSCHKSIYSVKFNDNFTGGIPDCWFSGYERSLFAEFKWYPNDRQSFDLTANKAPKLSRLQQHWLNGRLREGRDPWVIVGFPSGGIILTDGWWNYPHTVDHSLLTIREVAEAIERRCGIRDDSGGS